MIAREKDMGQRAGPSIPLCESAAHFSETTQPITSENQLENCFKIVFV